ncbi:hypothetical protein AVEN_151821-1 [Araneus ventricosus]|uniref:Uncharacterized protein n=1 Tax=Araneus ventricosus TaxID=182803 RepID=A0A4Y2JCF3_ARAVE|nr:hypothetical protein AVEN_151821-1 [Araneus ventricosus]
MRLHLRSLVTRRLNEFRSSQVLSCAIVLGGPASCCPIRSSGWLRLRRKLTAWKSLQLDEKIFRKRSRSGLFPPLNYGQSATPVEGLTTRISSIQLGTYSNWVLPGCRGSSQWKTQSKAVKDVKGFSETSVPDQISKTFQDFF